jgi:pimeloyl-ACP methyl ester carboxylesterase
MPDELAVTENSHLVPAGLLRRWADLPGFANVHPYDPLMAALQTTFTNVVVDLGDPICRDLSANVVAFPYDFRRSLVEAAELLDVDIRERREYLGNPDVIVVGHSAGGIVARYWIGELGGRSACRGLVTLGTPFRGLPRAADWLANGVRISGIRLTGATEVVRTWPSVQELLPQYPAIASNDASGDWLTRRQMPDALLPFGYPQAWAPVGLHRAIQQTWGADVGMPLLCVISGHGHHTTSTSAYGDPKLWRADHSSGPDSSTSGDGTVPEFSSQPIESNDHQRFWRTGYRHGSIVACQEAIDAISQLNSPLTAKATSDLSITTQRSTIGAALPEIAWAENDLSILLHLTSESDENDMPRWAVEVRADAGRARRVAGVVTERSGRTCHAHVPPLRPGRYRVSVRARLGCGDTCAELVDYLSLVTP